MILNYLLTLVLANQKLLCCTRAKKSPSHLQTSNRLCHLNILQGMSHGNDNPQGSSPSSVTRCRNIWSILFICFFSGNLTRVWSKSPVEPTRIQVVPRAHPGDTEPWWQEHCVPTRLCWMVWWLCGWCCATLAASHNQSKLVRWDEALTHHKPSLYPESHHWGLGFVPQLDSAQSRCRAGSQEQQMLKMLSWARRKRWWPTI